MRTLLMLAGGGALIYWWYSRGSAPAPAGTQPPAGTISPPAGTTTTPPQPVASELATLFSQMVANSGAGSTGRLTPHQWNYSLQIVRPSLTPPDPIALFGSVDAAAVQMTAADYWAVVSPYLTQTYGMSGLGRFSRWPWLGLPMGYA